MNIIIFGGIIFIVLRICIIFNWKENLIIEEREWVCSHFELILSHICQINNMEMPILIKTLGIIYKNDKIRDNFHKKYFCRRAYILGLFNLKTLIRYFFTGLPKYEGVRKYYGI